MPFLCCTMKGMAGLTTAQLPPTRGARSSSCKIPPRRFAKKTPQRLLTTQKSERIANARADQWMKADDRWCAKMAKSAHVIAMEPARSPSGEENAYAAAVASRKNL